MPRLGKNIDWSGCSGNPTWAIATLSVGTYGIYGSITLKAGMTITGTQLISPQGRSTHTITSAGVSFSQQLFFLAPGATYTLQDDLVTTDLIQIGNGIIVANGHNLTSSRLTSTGAGSTRGLTLGTSTVTLTGTGSVWSVNSTFLLSATYSTIRITDTGSSSKTFAGGGLSYKDLVITGSGSGAVIVTGNNTISHVVVTGAKTITLPAGGTQTFEGVFVPGTAGNVVTIQSSSAGSPANVIQTAGVVSLDYVSLKDVAASGPAPWFAGTHSTDVSGNSGISFTAAPSAKWGVRI